MTLPKLPPTWPYPHIIKPHAHRSGQWRLRRKGRDYYLGSWRDPDAALAYYLQHKAVILRGDPIEVNSRPEPVSPPSVLTLREALLDHLDRRLELVERGELSHSTYRGERETAKLILQTLDRHTPLDDLGPSHFDMLLSAWAHYGVFTRHRHIQATKAMLTKATERRRMRPPFFGPDFRPPRARALDERREQRGDRSLEPWQVLRLVTAADPTMRAMILLGVNGGYGGKDAANTRCGEVDLERARIHQKRDKTRAQRAVTLWPETVEALRPLIGGADDFLLRSRNGQPLQTDRRWNISDRFRDLTRYCGLDVELYDLRRTLQTVCDDRPGEPDDRATAVIMGHVVPGMKSIYNQSPFWGRIERQTEHVRAWLYGLRSRDPDGPSSDVSLAASSAERA